MMLRSSVAIMLMVLLANVKCLSQEDVKPFNRIARLVEDVNQRIDRAVVAKDMKFLSAHYGDDFVFTHGTGLVDSKKIWLESIRKSKGYASREHDSVVVELHKDIAIVFGKLTVGRLQPA